MQTKLRILVVVAVVWAGGAPLAMGLPLRGNKTPDHPILQNYAQRMLAAGVVLDPSRPGFTHARRAPLTEVRFAKLNVSRHSYPGTIAQLDDWMAQLVKIGPRPDIRPQIAISPSGSVNAYTPREDLIVLSAGLLEVLASKNGQIMDPKADRGTPAARAVSANDALWFVLAHQYAHILLAHPSRFGQEGGQSRTVQSITSGLVLLNQMSGVATITGTDVRAEFDAASKVLSTSLVAAPWIAAELQPSQYVAYSKKQEMLADNLAADLLHTLGCCDILMGAAAVRHIYQPTDEAYKKRMRSIRKQIEHQMEEAGSNHSLLSIGNLMKQPGNFGAMIKKKIIGQGIGRVVKLVDGKGRKNPHLYAHASSRFKALRKYGDAFGYARSVPAGKPAPWLTTFQQENRTEKSARNALELLAKLNISGAKSVLENTQIPADRDSYLYQYAKGKIASSAREHDVAIAALRRAVRAPDAPMDGYLALLESAVFAERKPDAFSALDLAAQKFGEREVIALRIKTHGDFMEYSAAKDLLLPCASFQDEALLQQCFDAMPAAPGEMAAPPKKKGLGFGSIMKKLPISLP